MSSGGLTDDERARLRELWRPFIEHALSYATPLSQQQKTRLAEITRARPNYARK